MGSICLAGNKRRPSRGCIHRKSRMHFMILFSALAAPVFSGAKNARYVFSLIDSNFAVKARIDTSIRSSRDPDTAEIKSAANSVSWWHGVRLNSQPVGDVWLAYERPADPGTVVFVSNTTPPSPLLTLYIDAMCVGCFHEYSLFGKVSLPDDTVRDGKKPDLVPLENDFRLGEHRTFPARIFISNPSIKSRSRNSSNLSHMASFRILDLS